MNIQRTLESVVKYINDLSGGNQMLAGAIGLWALGSVTYLCRSIPGNIYSFLVRHLTTDLTLTSQNISFHNLLSWLENKGYATKFRKVKLTNGRWGSEDDTTKSVGYGTHFIWYKSHPIRIQLTKAETLSDMDKESVTLCKLGRSHKILDQLIAEITEEKEDDDKTIIHEYRSSGWCFVASQPKRNLDSVFIEKEKLDALKKAFDDFVKNEDWYIKHGIPYQFGVIFHGPPGTGKTTLIRAFAAYLNKNICVATARGVNGGALAAMLCRTPKDSVVALEDVDTGISTGKRKHFAKKKNKEKKKTQGKGATPPPPVKDSETSAYSKEDITKSDADFFAELMGASLSEILNAIDGIVTNHGRILIMTTNCIDQIDSALLRPGRVDLSIEVGYVVKETFIMFMERFFDDIPEDRLNNIELTNQELTGAMLQEDILRKRTWQEILIKYTKCKEKNETIG